ncbi:MAG: alpha/beta hydrolase [Bacteroidetes bacterium]|nr:alpha/beta hydrolase [Bacteroidota bacterium]
MYDIDDAVAKIIFILIILYGLVLLAAYIFQERLLFYPSKLPSDYEFNAGPNAEELFLETSDNERINALHINKGSKKIILYFHGNAGVMDSWQLTYDNFKNTGYGLLIIDYRGYGKSTGTPSEKGLYADAQAAYNYLLQQGFDSDSIIIYGRSLGSGVACHLMAMHNKGRLILETPYTSIMDIAKKNYPYFIPQFTLRNRFSCIRYMKHIRVPLLLVHGTQDEVVPYHHVTTLHGLYLGPKTLITISNGAHNNLREFDAYTNALIAFLR